MTNFAVTGPELVSMGKRDFLERCPVYVGDILWEHLDIMNKGGGIAHDLGDLGSVWDLGDLGTFWDLGDLGTFWDLVLLGNLGSRTGISHLSMFRKFHFSIWETIWSTLGTNLISLRNNKRLSVNFRFNICQLGSNLCYFLNESC